MSFVTNVTPLLENPYRSTLIHYITLIQVRPARLNFRSITDNGSNYSLKIKVNRVFLFENKQQQNMLVQLCLLSNTNEIKWQKHIRNKSKMLGLTNMALLHTAFF